MDQSWLCVNGFGAHIKSTHDKLIIQNKKSCEEYQLSSIKNLMVVGGHMINTATISKLLRNGAYITFFEPNGTPVGTLRPCGEHYGSELNKKQLSISHHRYATEIAIGSLKSRLIFITMIEESKKTRLFYEGEMEFLHASLDEMSYLITLDEIRRLCRLTTDMYYEILSRNTPPVFGFRRRTNFPWRDPVNAMLSFGYSMLYGNCCVSLIGARLDPDLGILHVGKGSLIQDLIDSFKPSMIDSVVFQYAQEVLSDSDFELEPDRCVLSDETISELIRLFRHSIDDAKIADQVTNFRNAVLTDHEFKVLY